jgi:peroxiredoxin
MTFNKKSVSLLISIIIFILVIYILNRTPHVVNKTGSVAPNFSLQDIDGHTITLSSVKGRVIVLEFFATWCPPCRDSIPHLNNLKAKYKEKGLMVYGVNLDANIDAKTLKEFASDNQVQYDLLLSDENTGKLYNINSIPVTYVIDKNLIIKDVYVGFSEGLEGIIDKEVGAML